MGERCVWLIHQDHRPTLKIIKVGTETDAIEEYCILTCSPWLTFISYPGLSVDGIAMISQENAPTDLPID